MPQGLAIALAALLGATFGSFFNVVAYRLPRGESLSHPPSRCPHCETPIKPYDNIPVLGWLFLRGRCRSCGEPISIRYPLVELVTALLAVGVVVNKHGVTEELLGFFFIALLVPVTLIDLDYQIIPNKLLLPAAVVALAIGLITDIDFVPQQLISAAAAGGFFLLAVLAYPRGMGMGDVKLAAVMGLYLGRDVGPAIFIGLLSGSVAGVAIMARRGVAEGRKTKVPFGPFLALGGIVALFLGEPIVTWYLDHVT